MTANEATFGPMLTAAEVSELLEGISSRSLETQLIKRALIGLRDNDGNVLFPSFQFAEGRPDQILIEAFWEIAEGSGDAWLAASWCVSDDDALDGRSPVDWLRSGGDAARLLKVASQDAGRLGR